jgi:hypothetical protein
MPIRAVFETQDFILYEEVFINRKKFLNAVSRRVRDTFKHAIDIERGIVIYPSNLPEYRHVP